MGRNSGQTFATGHEDGVVKLWKVGQPSSFQQYGLNGSISSILLDPISKEQFVFVGNSGGTLRILDTHQHKSIRSYMAHRSEITCMDVHPLGNFIVTGSNDYNIKIWDVRQKSYVVNYRGHESKITSCKLSPDGVWLISGDENGIAKVWNITAGKLVREFHDSCPVVDIQFHPQELILATAAGKVVRLWDLESWSHLGRTEKGTTAVKKFCFSNTNYFVACTKDSMRSWYWDQDGKKCVCLDSSEAPWTDVQDVFCLPNTEQFISLQTQDNCVSLYKTDFSPQVNQPESKDDNSDVDINNTNSVPKSFAISPQKENYPNYSHTNSRKEKKSEKDRTVPVILEKISLPSNLPPELFTKSFVQAAIDLKQQRKKATTSDDLSYLQKFVPKELTSSQLNEMKTDLLSQHGTMMKILKTRLSRIRVMGSLWRSGNITELLEMLLTEEVSVCVDILNVCNTNLQTNLKESTILVKIIKKVLNQEFDGYIQLCAGLLLSVLKSQGPIIEATLMSQNRPLGVNVAGEERLKKCSNLFKEILEIECIMLPQLDFLEDRDLVDTCLENIRMLKVPKQS